LPYKKANSWILEYEVISKEDEEETYWEKTQDFSKNRSKQIKNNQI